MYGQPCALSNSLSPVTGVKASEGLSNQHPNASAIYTELKQLQANYRVVLTDQEVDQRELNAKQGACELLEQQIQLQYAAHKGLESQIGDLQNGDEKTTVQYI